jgi:hypothetical protein
MSDTAVTGNLSAAWSSSDWGGEYEGLTCFSTVRSRVAFDEVRSRAERAGENENRTEQTGRLRDRGSDQTNREREMRCEFS